MNSNYQKFTQNTIYSYIDKWRKILYATCPLNQLKVTEIINKACSILNYPKPQIIFCKSPLEALIFFINGKHSISLYKHLKFDLERLINDKSLRELRCKFYSDTPEIKSLFFK